MNNQTFLQRVTAANNIKRMDRIHEYYQKHPGCTIEDAVTFTPETSAMVQKYSKLRTKRQQVLDGVITPDEQKQLDRMNNFDAIKSHVSKEDTKRMSISRPHKIKITAEQVVDVKHRLADGQAIINITRDTGVSEYHIRGVRRGRYNILLDMRQESHIHPPRR